jgi:hypothetical protein
MKKFPLLYLVLSMVYSANSFAADKNVVFFITDDQDPHEAKILPVIQNMPTSLNATKKN